MPTVGTTASIEDALAYHLSTLSPAVVTAWPDVAFTPVVGTPYLEPRFLPNQTEFGAIGANAQRRHRGLYQVLVYSPEQQGSIAGSELADRVIAHFDPMTVIARNGVRVRIGSYDGGAGIPWRSSAFKEGGFSIIPVTVPWWCDVYPQ